MKMFLKRFTAFFISSLLFLFSLSGTVLVSSDDSEKNNTKTVLILESDSYGYIQMINNKYSGYYVDYLNEISMYTDWNYNYLIVDDTEFKEHIKKGDYDLVAGVIDDGSKDDYLNFSRSPMGIKKYSLSVRKDNPEVIYENYQSMNGLNIGISERDLEFEKSFKQFLNQNNIKYRNDSKSNITGGVNLVHINGDKNEQLLNGEVDGILCTNENAYRYDLFAAITYDTVPIYLAVKKGDYDSLKSIENAQSEIYSSNSDFITNLYDDAFSNIYKTKLAFSDKEKNFLDEKRVYNVALLDNKAPYSYIDDDDEACGLVVETFNMISEMTSYMVTFKYKFYDTYYDAQDAIMNGHCDIVGLSLSTSPSDRNCIKNTSKVFFEDVYYYYKNTETKVSFEDGIFAVHKNFPDEFLEKAGINKDKIVYADTTMECFELVDLGKADYTLALHNIGDFYVQSESFNNVEFMDKKGTANSFAAGFSKNINQTMIEIFDKCLSHIDDEFYDGYIVSYMFSEVVDTSFSGTIANNKIFVIVFTVIFVISICFLCILLVKTVSVRRKSRNRFEFSINLLEKINSMVQSLNVLSTIIRENNDDIDKEAYIKRIEDTSKSLSHIIDNSEKLTKISYNALDSKQSSFWIKDLTDDLLLDISEFANKYKIDVRIVVEKDVPSIIVGDRSRIYEILFNLLLNAIKYNHANGSVYLRIGLSSYEYKNFVTLLFSVEDSGIGIHEENIKKIFNPFFREDRVGINNISGAGIGLTLSKHYVEEMGGVLKVNSNINEGSCFYFEIKFKMTDESEKISEILEIRTEYNLSGKRYLLVNSNELEGEVTNCLFESINAIPVCVSDWEDAYSAFADSETGYFDGIIIKMDLHNKQCFDVVRNIRSLHRRDSKSIVIVGVLDNLTADNINKVLECGVDECIDKNTDNSKLLDIIERAGNNKKKKRNHNKSFL